MPINGFQKITQYLPAPWLLVALLLGCFFIFSLRNQEVPLATHSEMKKAFPQVYMNNVQTREFDEQGKLHYELSTPRISHYQVNPEAPSENDYILIKDPKITFYDAGDKAPWQVTARQGRSDANGHLIRLLENVLIQQQSTDQGLLEITASELNVRTREQFAETDKAVKMRSAKGQIDAVGMSADLAESRVQLHSQVNAVYDPR